MAANQGQEAATTAMLAALQQAITNLTEGQATLVQIVQQQQQQLAAMQPGATTTFHTSPAQARMNEVLDLTDRAGIAIFEHSEKGDSIKYDLASDGLLAFKQRMKEGAKLFGCDRGVHSVIHYTTADGAKKNVLEHYGELTVNQLKVQSVPFITGDKKDTRQGQNNELFAKFMLNSLKRDAYKSIMVYEKDFSIERDGERIHSVPLLWKRICAYPSLQTKRTTTNLRDYLRELPSQINTLGIEKFNEAFKAGMEELQSRGKSIDDPDRICFDGFQKTIDDRFNKVFLQMEDDIDNEFGPYKDYTWEEICSKASEVYTRYKKDWGKKSEAEQQLDALKAEMERLAKEKKSLCDQLQELQAPTKDSADKKTKGKSNRSSDSKAADTAAGGKKDEAWRFDPPAEGDPHSKVVDGKTSHWCPFHLAWCGHSSDNCELGKRRAQGEQQDDTSGKPAAAPASVAKSSADDKVASRAHDMMAKLASLSTTGLVHYTE